MTDIRVLLVDASADDLRWVRVLTATASEIALHWEASLERAVTALPVNEFDLVLLDDAAGTLDAAELVNQLRARGWTRPAIILAARHDEEAAVRALRAGADDYIVKEQITASGFVRAVRHAVERDRATAKIALQARMLSAAEQQLRQAQKLEAIGQLAGGIAHDFNNVLTAIRGYGDIIRSALPSADPLQHEVRELLAAADRAASLTQQLLAFGRRQVLRPRWLDMRDVARELEPLLRGLFADQRVQFDFHLAPELPRILADSAQIQHVVTQLVENARDATPDGGTVAVSVEAVALDDAFVSKHPGSRSGKWLRISVLDNGTGMSQAVRARVFEPFFTTKNMGEGAGLGLSTSYGIVEQSGGFMDVSSREGEGSRFDVYLPIGTEPARRHDTPPTPAPLGGGRVLVVEDSAPVRAVVVRTLRKAGYEVMEAGDGEQGLAAAARADAPIQLVIADRQMPRLGGWEMAMKLRAESGGHPPPRVLIMSGDTPEALGIADMPSGVYFIGKPFSGSALLERVRTILDGAASAPDDGSHAGMAGRDTAR